MVLGPNKWIHQDTTLLNQKVVYIAKFIGVIEASGPRGMAVVREAIQKLKFSRHIKQTEGNKAAKVELSINVHGMIITDAKTKTILHNIPLERVSFCADDKQDPRLFSFIARADDGKHYCYGLDSQHEANHITLTIGQSFELAYTSVIKSDEGVVASKQVMDLNKRIQVLEKENFALKHRISELEKDSVAQKENKSLEYSVQGLEGIDAMACGSSLHITSPTMLVHQPNSEALKETSLTSHVADNMDKPSLGGSTSHARKMQKQVYIDQTIASVEKAKHSLKNLKEFVKQRKKQRMGNVNGQSPISMCSGESVATTCVQTKVSSALDSCADVNILERTSNKMASPVNQTHGSNDGGYSMFNSSQTSKPQATKPGANNTSAASLFAGLNEVMVTIEDLMKVEKQIKNTAVKRKNQQENNLPETILSDMLGTSDERGEYENLCFVKSSVSSKMDPAESMLPPPIPPKPLNMQPAFSSESVSLGHVSGSAYSTSSSDISSSADAISGNAYYFNSPFLVNQPAAKSEEFHELEYAEKYRSKLVDSESLFNTFVEGNISDTLNRLSGEQGYMELKQKVDEIEGDVYVDSVYDNVQKLMETIRKENSVAKSQMFNSPLSDGGLNNTDKVVEKQKRRQMHSFVPYDANTRCGVGKMERQHWVSLFFYLLFKFLFSFNVNFYPFTSHNVSSTPVVPLKDGFDMTVFHPPQSTLVKPPSPMQGNQTVRSGRHRSASNTPTYSDTKNLPHTNVDPIGDFMKLNEELNRFNSASKTKKSELIENLLSSPTFSNFLQQLSSTLPHATQPTSQNKSVNDAQCNAQSGKQGNKLINKVHGSGNKQRNLNRGDEFNRKMKILEEGFSKGLTMQEAESSLDAFDPLKVGK
ncbi:uncharacterized protein LOC100182079 [Ciona intestinalis]